MWGYPGEEGVRLGLEWRFIDSGPFTRLAVGGLRGVVWGCVDCRGLYGVVWIVAGLHGAVWAVGGCMGLWGFYLTVYAVGDCVWWLYVAVWAVGDGVGL